MNSSGKGGRVVVEEEEDAVEMTEGVIEGTELALETEESLRAVNIGTGLLSTTEDSSSGSQETGAKEGVGL